MFNLSSYLDKFKNLKDPKEDKSVISGIIFENTGIRIPEQEIEINKGTLYLKSSPMIRSRIFLNREAIIESVDRSLPGLNIKDIR